MVSQMTLMTASLLSPLIIHGSQLRLCPTSPKAISGISLMRQRQTGTTGIENGSRSFYADCVAAMPAELPKILMGHLFVQGGKISDSERNVQIGGATATHASDFPAECELCRLGTPPQTTDDQWHRLSDPVFRITHSDEVQRSELSQEGVSAGVV